LLLLLLLLLLLPLVFRLVLPPLTGVGPMPAAAAAAAAFFSTKLARMTRRVTINSGARCLAFDVGRGTEKRLEAARSDA
jgi:hypothetical protein